MQATHSCQSGQINIFVDCIGMICCSRNPGQQVGPEMSGQNNLGACPSFQEGVRAADSQPMPSEKDLEAAISDSCLQEVVAIPK